MLVHASVDVPLILLSHDVALRAFLFALWIHQSESFPCCAWFRPNIPRGRPRPPADPVGRTGSPPFVASTRATSASRTQVSLYSRGEGFRQTPAAGGGPGRWAHLHHLQLLQALLHQLLYLPRLLDRLVLPKCISCPPLRVFPEIVRVELSALTEELAILRGLMVNITT